MHRRASLILTIILGLVCADCGDSGTSADGALADASVDQPAIDATLPDAPPPDAPFPDLPALDLPAPDLPPPDAPALDAPVPDAPVADQPVPDMLVPDLPVPDMPVPDMPVPDAPVPDMPVPDAPVPDAPVPDLPAPDSTISSDASGTIYNVIYSSGTLPNKLEGVQIKSDGSGKKAVPGMPTQFYFATITLVGRRPTYNVTNRQSATLHNLDNSTAGVLLAKGQGYLYYYIDATGRGFFQLRPDGTAKILAHAAGYSDLYDTYSGTIAFNDDETLFVAVAGMMNSTRQMKLIRVDGKTFAATKTGSCDVIPASSSMWSTHPWGIQFAGGQVYFWGRDLTPATYPYGLYRAPGDCSTGPVKVALPKVGVATPIWIGERLHRSTDGKKLILLAGASSSSHDLIIVDSATGVAVNLTESPGRYGMGSFVMERSYGTEVEISPDNKHIAYVAKTGTGSPYTDDLYVRLLDKSKPAVHVTSAPTFSSTFDEVHSLYWLTNDDLVFWAGSGSYNTDLFHYKLSTKAIVNLTKSGSANAPFTTAGDSYPYNGWVSPNGKYLLFGHYSGTGSIPPKGVLRAIERATQRMIAVTPTTMFANSAWPYLIGAQGSTRVFATVLPGNKKRYDNIYYFDQNAPGPAVQLTTLPMSGTEHAIYAVIPDYAGNRVSFIAGPSAYQRDVYVAEVTPKHALYKLTSVSLTTNTYTVINKVFSPGGVALVHGLGTVHSQRYDVRAQNISGGTATILNKSEDYTAPLLAW